MNGGIIYLSVWAEGNTDQDPKNYVITTAEAPKSKDDWTYQINRNVALIEYKSIVGNYHCELWHLSHPSVQLKLPDCDPFLTENERQKKESYQGLVDWLLDTTSNSEYLIRLYREDDIYFVLVFDGLTSFKYTKRITMPENVRGGIGMQIFGSGKNAKTVLTVHNQSQFFVFDMSNGQMVLTIPLSQSHTSSGQYLFPTDLIVGEDILLGGVDVIRIDCDGQNWTTSTMFATFPHIEEEIDDIHLQLEEVTETQTLWREGYEYYLCDYLLNESYLLE